MSTLTAPIPMNTAGVHTRPGIGRLVAVELRKMLDTRAGFWMQIATVAITVVVVAARSITGEAADHTFASVLSLGLQPAAVLLPVAGILLVTSEWSQRTGMITFALVPVRARVIGAKLIASIVLALVMLVMSVAVVAAGVVLASPGVDGTWSDAATLIGQSAIFLTTGILVGVGFGAIVRLGAGHRRAVRAADHVDGDRLAEFPLGRGPVAGHAPGPRPAARGGSERDAVGARRLGARDLDAAAAPDRPVADHAAGDRRLMAAIHARCASSRYSSRSCVTVVARRRSPGRWYSTVTTARAGPLRPK